MGAALAIEALRDQDFILNLRQKVKPEKNRLIKELSGRGYLVGETCESCPIFIVGHKDEDVDLRGNFLSKGILMIISWPGRKANIICSIPCWLPSQEPARYDRSIPGVLVSSDNSSDMSHHPDPIGFLSSDP